MSTILKALKKLEQEHESRQIIKTAQVPNLNASQVVQERMKSGWTTALRTRWTWALIALIIAFAAGYLLINRPLKSQPASKASAILPETPPPSRSKRADKTPVASVRSDSKRYAAAPEKSASINTNSPLKQDKSLREPAPKPAAQNRSANVTKTGQPQKSGDTVDLKEKPKPTEKEILASAPRLTDGRLGVQAIAWSPVAQERMAVINNRVVREGFVVDGFSIEIIGENEIMVSEGEKRWKVRFGQP
jgi:hypothetical protein